MSEEKKQTAKERLIELGVAEDMISKIETGLGITKVEQLALVTESDLTGPDVGMAKIPARELAAALKPKAEEVAPPTSTVSAVSFDSILPPVPSDSSWLAALKAGGVLKVDESTVISVVRATLANRVGLYSITDKLVAAMEDFSDKSEEQVDPEFFKLRKMMTRRTYADIFDAVEGLDGSFVTEARKKQLLQKVDRDLWPAIIDYYKQLKSWQDGWMQGAANPALLMNAIMAASGGIGMMPPGIMQQPPETGVLRDQADAVSDAINKVFAGTGVQIAAALAYDANRIKETLENPRLPALIGAANRDMMLRQLGVAVSATYPRMEQNLTRFVLSIMQVKNQPSGSNEELQYFGTLLMLGSQIPWDTLSGNSNKLSGIGGK